IAHRVDVRNVGAPPEEATSSLEPEIVREPFDRLTLGPVADHEPAYVGKGLGHESERAQERGYVLYGDEARDDGDVPAFARKAERRERIFPRGQFAEVVQVEAQRYLDDLAAWRDAKIYEIGLL